MATNYTADLGKAKIVLRNAYLQAYLKRNDIRHDTPMRPWFMRIVADCCMQQRFGRLDFEAGSGIAESENLATESLLENEDDQLQSMIQEDVFRQLSKLSKQERLIFILRFYENMTIDEIAYVMKAKPEIITVKLLKAVQKVRHHEM